MPDTWALVVAVEKPLDPAFPHLPYGEAGAKAVADALAVNGVAKARQFVLLGQHATKSAVESRLRKLKKAVKKGDTVLAWLAGRGYSKSGRGAVGCWDTLPDDLIDSSLLVAGLVAELTATKAAAAILFLDVGHTALPANAQPAGVEPTLDADELHALFADHPKAVALMSGDPDEASLWAAAVASGAWAHLIAEGLAGRAVKAATKAGIITASSLHHFAADELPRLLRKHFDGGATQTPVLYGEQNGALQILDLSAVLGGAAAGGLLDSDRLRRVMFRADSSTKVKDLRGFRKSFQIPDFAGPSSRKFIAKCATDDIRADVDGVYEAARVHLGYKRKDIDTITGQDGFGSLRSPDFEYTVTATLDKTDPSRVTWRRELGQLADAGFVRGAGFAAVFGGTFDQLAFEFAKPVDVAALIDKLEDATPAGVTLHVESDGGAVELTLAKFAGRVRVERTTLTVRGRAGNSAGLLDQFLAFLQKVGPLGEPLMLQG